MSSQARISRIELTYPTDDVDAVLVDRALDFDHTSIYMLNDDEADVFLDELRRMKDPFDLDTHEFDVTNRRIRFLTLPDAIRESIEDAVMWLGPVR